MLPFKKVTLDKKQCHWNNNFWPEVKMREAWKVQNLILLFTNGMI